jgi:hypothetical protein
MRYRAPALPIIVTGFALGVTSVNKMPGGVHLNDPHKKWGVAIFVLYFFQLSLGAFVHFVKIPFLRILRRSAHNYFHAIFGIFLIGIAFYQVSPFVCPGAVIDANGYSSQVRTGFRTEWPLYTGRGSVGNGANIVWIIWLVVSPASISTSTSAAYPCFRACSSFRRSTSPACSSCRGSTASRGRPKTLSLGPIAVLRNATGGHRRPTRCARGFNTVYFFLPVSPHLRLACCSRPRPAVHSLLRLHSSAALLCTTALGHYL